LAGVALLRYAALPLLEERVAVLVDVRDEAIALVPDL